MLYSRGSRRSEYLELTLRIRCLVATSLDRQRGMLLNLVLTGVRIAVGRYSRRYRDIAIRIARGCTADETFEELVSGCLTLTLLNELVHQVKVLVNGVKRLRVAVLVFRRIGNVVVGTLLLWHVSCRVRVVVVGLVLAEESAEQGLVAEISMVGAVRVSPAHRVIRCRRVQLHKRVRACTWRRNIVVVHHRCLILRHLFLACSMILFGVRIPSHQLVLRVGLPLLLRLCHAEATVRLFISGHVRGKHIMLPLDGCIDQQSTSRSSSCLVWHCGIHFVAVIIFVP